MNRVSQVVSALLLAACVPASASFLSQVDDFQDGTKQNWGANAQSALTVADDGGERFLSYTSNGFGGPNSRMVIPMNAAGNQWQGDYLAGGVLGFEVDVANPGSVDLNLWFTLGSGEFSSDGSWYASATPVAVPAGADWTTIQFSAAADDLVLLRGPDTAEGLLAAVTQVRLSSSAGLPPLSFGGGGSPQGDIVAATLWMDNFRAIGIPEPATAWLAAIGALAVVRRRR